jgi:hypothetical protein
MRKLNFIRFLLTLVYVAILWVIIAAVAIEVTETSGAQLWGLIALCSVAAICHVVSVTYYDLARRMY